MNEHKNNRPRYESREPREELPIERNALVELTKNEQEHRHQLQENQQRANNVSYFFGMVFGFLYNIALLYFIYDLVEKGYRSFALKLFLTNAMLIVGSFGLLTFSRKLSFTKKSFGKKQGNYDHKRHNKTRN